MVKVQKSRFVLLFAILALICVSPLLGARIADNESRSTCPPGDDAKRDLVVSFLTEEKWADDRSELGISGISSSQVRLLTDSQDASVCEQIDVIDRKNPPQYEIAYYEAGGYYFVVTEVITEEGEMYLGQKPFVVLDSDIKALKFYLI